MASYSGIIQFHRNAAIPCRWAYVFLHCWKLACLDWIFYLVLLTLGDLNVTQNHMLSKQWLLYPNLDQFNFCEHKTALVEAQMMKEFASDGERVGQSHPDRLLSGATVNICGLESGFCCSGWFTCGSCPQFTFPCQQKLAARRRLNASWGFIWANAIAPPFTMLGSPE